MKRFLNYFYLLVTLSFISCNSKKEMPEIFNREDALTAYEEFKNKLHSSDRSSTIKLLNNLKEWKVLEDTVLHFLIIDSTQDQIHEIQDMSRCAVIRNDITNEIIRLTDSQLHTYSDIIYIQQSFNEYSLREKCPDLFHHAECFFNELTTKTHVKKTAHEIMTEYANRLLYWKSRGFSSRQDILDFIKEEDSLFVNFIDHLYEYDSQSVKTIITMTDYISELMFRAADEKELDIKELRIYMGVRTNRRLIQNATKCTDAIRLNQIKTPEQADMTVSILLNPYSNYNRICTGLHTKSQIEALHVLGKQISPMISYLKQQGLIKKNLPDSLPNKIIKEHILITMK